LVKFCWDVYAEEDELVALSLVWFDFEETDMADTIIFVCDALVELSVLSMKLETQLSIYFLLSSVIFSSAWLFLYLFITSTIISDLDFLLTYTGFDWTGAGANYFFAWAGSVARADYFFAWAGSMAGADYFFAWAGSVAGADYFFAWTGFLAAGWAFGLAGEAFGSGLGFDAGALALTTGAGWGATFFSYISSYSSPRIEVFIIGNSPAFKAFLTFYYFFALSIAFFCICIISSYFSSNFFSMDASVNIGTNSSICSWSNFLCLLIYHCLFSNAFALAAKSDNAGGSSFFTTTFLAAMATFAGLAFLVAFELWLLAWIAITFFLRTITLGLALALSLTVVFFINFWALASSKICLSASCSIRLYFF
jgi:hypothetical protein